MVVFAPVIGEHLVRVETIFRNQGYRTQVKTKLFEHVMSAEGERTEEMGTTSQCTHC